MIPAHILGISCSTRIIGLAVFYNQQLIDYATILDKQRWTQTKKQKFMQLIAQHCTVHRITHIALVVPQQFYQTDESTELLKAIEELAALHSIVLSRYGIADLHYIFGNRIQHTRASLIRRMAMLYNELEPLELKELQNKNKYYIKLFEAVASASLLVLKNYEKQG